MKDGETYETCRDCKGTGVRSSPLSAITICPTCDALGLVPHDCGDPRA